MEFLKIDFDSLYSLFIIGGFIGFALSLLFSLIASLIFFFKKLIHIGIKE